MTCSQTLENWIFVKKSAQIIIFFNFLIFVKNVSQIRIHTKRDRTKFFEISENFLYPSQKYFQSLRNWMVETAFESSKFLSLKTAWKNLCPHGSIYADLRVVRKLFYFWHKCLRDTVWGHFKALSNLQKGWFDRLTGYISTWLLGVFAVWVFPRVCCFFLVDATNMKTVVQHETDVMVCFWAKQN